MIWKIAIGIIVVIMVIGFMRLTYEANKDADKNITRIQTSTDERYCDSNYIDELEQEEPQRDNRAGH